MNRIYPYAQDENAGICKDHCGKSIFFTIDILIVFLISACQPEKNPVADISADDFAVKVIEKIYTLNAKYMSDVICNNCKYNPYYRLAEIKMSYVDEYEKKGIDFRDPSSHDFSNVKCILSNKTTNYMYYQCTGYHLIKDQYNKAVAKNVVNNTIRILIEDGLFKTCPIVCSK